MLNREERLQQIRETGKCDVLIVGAGINGIGAYRDLALQGVNVVLIDRDDYCSGASAASSHMIHGGVRYLENGEFRLVNEAVQERGHLLKNAPHLVKPLPTTFPIFKWISGLLNAPLQFFRLRFRPSERGAVVIKIGLMFYEWFARRGRVVPRHVMRNQPKSLEIFPDLNPEIIFTATYYDAVMNSPERLALEVLHDGTQANPKAIALNYVSLKSSKGDVVMLEDRISGEIIEFRPKLLINAAGPWVDFVNASMGHNKRYIGGTKGSHLVLDHPELRAAIGDHEIFFENKDGRIVLILPFFEHVQIGSSDIRIDDPDEAVITEEEIDYFFAMVKLVFPKIKVNRSQIVFTFSGVRPLPYAEEGSTGQISRDHKIELIQPDEQRSFPLFSLIGGKWTTFRAFAEHTSSTILKWLKLPRLVDTRNLEIGGGRNFPIQQQERERLLAAWQESYQCSKEMADLFLERYGTNATDILVDINANQNNIQLSEFPEYYLGEIKYIVGREDVIHLDDLVFRRSSIAMRGRITEQGLAELAQITADVLNWDEQKKAAEIQRVQRILRDKHRMHFNRYLPLMNNLEEEVS